MSDPFIGQIIAVGFNFAPNGWAFCNGQSLAISEYEALYTLIGTTYGGDGQSTFNLPDLRGRAALGLGQGPGRSNYVLGQPSGAEMVTITANQIGAHTHTLMAASKATNSAPAVNEVFSTTEGEPVYGKTGSTTPLAPASVGTAGGGAQPHDNLQPFQTINYIIALYGIYPQQA